MRKIITLMAAAGAAVFLVPAVASAAPKAKPDETITLDCPGTFYDGEIVNAGDGPWTPGFRGGAVLLPVSFGPFSGTFTSDDGTFSFTEPPVVQNANKGGTHTRIECTYTIEDVSDDGTLSGGASVVLVIVGRP